MNQSEKFMGHFGLEYALNTPMSEVKEKVITLNEKEKRRLRIMQRTKTKVRQQKEERRREACFK